MCYRSARLPAETQHAAIQLIASGLIKTEKAYDQKRCWTPNSLSADPVTQDRLP